MVQDVVGRPSTNATLNAEYLTESTEEEMDRHRNRLDGSVGYQAVAVDRRRHRANNEMRNGPSIAKVIHSCGAARPTHTPSKTAATWMAKTNTHVTVSSVNPFAKSSENV